MNSKYSVNDILLYGSKGDQKTWGDNYQAYIEALPPGIQPLPEDPNAPPPVQDIAIEADPQKKANLEKDEIFMGLVKKLKMLPATAVIKKADDAGYNGDDVMLFATDD